MGKKLSLPVLPGSEEGDKPKKPGVDSARARLGGRSIDDTAPPPGLASGQIVSVPSGDGDRRPAVVLYVNGEEAHVLFDPTHLKRLPPSELGPLAGPAPQNLVELAADARLFSLMSEGETIRYADDGGSMRGGRVVEKCRYGALIVRDDGAIVAVGFRKLWPGPKNAPTCGEA